MREERTRRMQFIKELDIREMIGRRKDGNDA
jgi:hypothetical protein